MKKIFLISTALLLNQSILADVAQTSSAQQAAELTRDSAQWRIAPRIRIQPCDLENQNRKLDLQITANPQGKVTDVKVLESTGVDHLDQKIIKTVYASRFRPTGETFTVSQAFALNFTGQPTALCRPVKQQNTCVYLFETKILGEQILKHKTPFQYKEVPKFFIHKDELKGESREIHFSFKLTNKDQISNIKINKSSGLNHLDQQVISALSTTRITSDKKWWQFYKVTHQDQIVFDLNKCP